MTARIGLIEELACPGVSLNTANLLSPMSSFVPMSIFILVIVQLHNVVLTYFLWILVECRI